MICRASVLVCVLLAPLSTLAQPLPEGALARLGNQRFSGLWGLGVALSPDGKMLASANSHSESQPGGIILWDANAGKPVRTAERGDILEQNWGIALAWSPNGKSIAVATTSRFQVWDAETGKRLTPNKKLHAGFGFSSMSAFRFVTGDRLLAFVGRKYDHRGYFVELWDTAAGTRSASWSLDKSKWESLADGHDVHHVALSPSGEQMAWLTGPAPDAKEGSSTVYVYETLTDKLLHTVSGLPRAYRIDLPDEGQTLVLHPLRKERVEKITTGEASVVSIPTGKVRFQCTYRFQPVEQMHTTGHKPPPAYVTSGNVNREAIRFQDTLVIPDEIGLTRWDLKTGQKLEEFNEPFESFAVSANGKRLAVRENSLMASPT